MTAACLKVETTLPSLAEAKTLQLVVLEKKMAACVQIEGPVESAYWWQGQLQQAQEWRCSMKTTPEKLEPLKACVLAHHPYDLPELLVTRMEAEVAYMNWIEQEVTHD